ncbi:hypothetical protein, partial [Pseudomonas sp. EA_65y_Pfl1_P113]|uniref:hypothetical protein n=1 Tax=Pseudomonas sp. EA_65y_Pfl1_P113 TaxID=3088692 RepID=UPI0030DB908F
RPVEHADGLWVPTPTQSAIFASQGAFTGTFLFSFKTKRLPAFSGRSSACLPEQPSSASNFSVTGRFADPTLAFLYDRSGSFP